MRSLFCGADCQSAAEWYSAPDFGPFPLSSPHSVCQEITSPIAGNSLTFSLYATGLGAVNVNLPLGAAGPTAPTANTAALPRILLGGAPLTVTFSGLAPGFVGLYQVNASIPSAPAQGNFTGPFTLTINGQTASWQPAQQ